MGSTEIVYCPAGFGQQHDWRLWERVPINVYDIGRGWRERWYCTRCRTVEERTVEA